MSAGILKKRNNHLAKFLVLKYIPKDDKLYKTWAKTQDNPPPLISLSISHPSYLKFLLTEAKIKIHEKLPKNHIKS